MRDFGGGIWWGCFPIVSPIQREEEIIKVYKIDLRDLDTCL